MWLHDRWLLIWESSNSMTALAKARQLNIIPSILSFQTHYFLHLSVCSNKILTLISECAGKPTAHLYSSQKIFSHDMFHNIRHALKSLVTVHVLLYEEIPIIQHVTFCKLKIILSRLWNNLLSYCIFLALQCLKNYTVLQTITRWSLRRFVKIYCFAVFWTVVQFG